MTTPQQNYAYGALCALTKQASDTDSATPWLGLGAGLGALALMRTPLKASLTKAPALRKIQDAARGSMHIIQDVADAPETLWEKIKYKLTRAPTRFEGTNVNALGKALKDPINDWDVLESGFAQHLKDTGGRGRVPDTSNWYGHGGKSSPNRMPEVSYAGKTSPGRMPEIGYAGKTSPGRMPEIGYAGKTSPARAQTPTTHAPSDVTSTAPSNTTPEAVWTSDTFTAPRPGTFDASMGAATTPAEIEAAIARNKLIESKWKQYELFNKFAPGSMPETINVGDFAKKHGLKLRHGSAHYPSDLEALQKKLTAHFGDDRFLLKAMEGRDGGDIGLSSGGSFPFGHHDWKSQHQGWREIKPFYDYAAPIAEPNTLAMMNADKAYAGRIFDEIPHNNVIAQKLVDPEMLGDLAKEYRVHVTGGQAIPSMAMPRWDANNAEGIDGARALWENMKGMVEARRAAKWLQGTLDKLPEEYKQMSHGVDVMKLRDGSYKIIESNPGGGSGLIDNPLVSPLLHRAVTGRHTLPVSLAGGLGAAGIGSASAAALNDSSS